MWNYIVQGGPVMIPLLACSILLVAILMERHRSLKVLKFDMMPFKAQMRDRLRGRDIDGAIRLCEETPGPLAQVIHAGLVRYKHLRTLTRTEGEVEAGVTRAMEDHAGEVVNGLERYLGVMFIIGNVAPLLGFLGTVMGMINCFKAIARSGGLRPEVVAAGISEALITCATGLFIAIPAFAAYHHYTTRIKDFVVDTEVTASECVSAIVSEDKKTDGGKA